MRRLALVLAVAALLAAACDSSTARGHHWRAMSTVTLTRTVTVTMTPTTAADPFFLRGANHGITVWNQSPFVNLVLDVSTGGCPSGVHCVGVTRAPRNGATTFVGWDSSLHMYGNGANLVFDSAPWAQPDLDNAWCHELGHALGLSHSSHGLQGPCQGGVPTDHDYGLIVDLYSHDDGGTFSRSTVEDSTDARGGGSRQYVDTRDRLRGRGQR